MKKTMIGLVIMAMVLTTGCGTNNDQEIQKIEESEKLIIETENVEEVFEESILEETVIEEEIKNEDQYDWVYTSQSYDDGEGRQIDVYRNTLGSEIRVVVIDVASETIESDRIFVDHVSFDEFLWSGAL